MITSKNNPQLKNIRLLMESAKARRNQGLFVVEGVRMAEEVPLELVERVYVNESLAQDENERNRKVIQRFGADAETVSDDVFKSLSDTVNPQGIMVVVRQPKYALENLADAEKIVILDDVRDPGNLGTIVRTSEAAGAMVVMSRECADIFNPKVIRSTMGSIFRVPFVIGNLKEIIPVIQKTGVKVWAAALDGSVSYEKAEYGQKNAFIIGNEANGVSREVIDAADGCVRIPMMGKVESLNAAISAAVLLYHLPPQM